MIAPSGRIKTSPLSPDEGLYVDAADFNNDGALDLIVGGYSNWIPLTKKLTPAREDRIEELDAQIEKYNQALNALFDQGKGLSSEELQAFYDKLTSSAEYKKLNNQMRTARTELRQLRPSPNREPGVWLYLQKQ